MYIDNEFTDSQTWATSQYEGSAHFFLMSDDYARFIKTPAYLLRMSPTTMGIITETRINVDLVVNTVVQRFAEYEQVVPYVGDSFSHYFYGASPIILNVSAYLVDTLHSMGKLELMELYRWLFRISRVAKTGIAPYFTYAGFSIHGAMLSMDVSETGALQDILEVRFQFLVFSTRFLSPLNENAKDTAIDFSVYNDVMVD